MSENDKETNESNNLIEEKDINTSSTDKKEEINTNINNNNEKITELQTLKEEGDKFLNEKNYQSANSSYTKAVINFKVLRDNGSLTEEEKSDLTKKILIPCNLNMSFIDLKNKDWNEVIRHANKVLHADKSNVKAKYRRCYAYIKIGKFEKADEDLQDLEELIGGNDELEELEKMYEKNKKKADGNDGELLKRMGKKLKKGGNFIHENNNNNNEKKGFFRVVWNHIKLICCCGICFKKNKKVKNN